MTRILARTTATLLLLGLAATAGAQVTLRNMTLEAHRNDFPGQEFSACWAYVHPDGREYAVLGTAGGTAIYNVTNPAAVTQVGFIPGPLSDWREMKSYRTWIYIVTEGTGNPDEGVQIVSMANPQSPVLVGTYTTGFVSSHTISVDTTRAILVCNGTRSKSGKATGMRVLSIGPASGGGTPTAPQEITWWPGGAIPVATADYIHDCEPIGNRLYASSIYSGIQRVFDFTNPAAPSPIASWTYAGANLTHSAWPDGPGACLYVTDEANGQPLRMFDISNPASPVLVNTLTPNPAAIVHNPRVQGTDLFLAAYTEGVRVLDAADPFHPAEFGYADSWPGASGGFSGVWEVCPYFPSGTVIASDINSGLYVYRVVRNYGVIRVRVVDAASGVPLAGIAVTAGPGLAAVTSPRGVVQFAPNPGAYLVEAVRPGYAGASATVQVAVGTRDTLEFAIATGSLAGTVSVAGSGAPLADAGVEIEGVPGHQHTNAAGAYAFTLVPADTYDVHVHAAGHVPQTVRRLIGPAYPGGSFHLSPAGFWDAIETDLGWTAGLPADDAQSGAWVRGDPLGTGIAAAPLFARDPARPFHDDSGEGQAPGDVQPETDHTPSPGTLCFLTGQSNTPGEPVGNNDVDNGRTTLVTPALDLTGYADPVIGYWRWFYTRDGDASDWFLVEISGDNGATWVPVETVYGAAAHWSEHAIRVLDFVPATAQVKARFVAADLAPGGIVEAALDDLVIYESGAVAVGREDPPVARLAWRRPSPNPSAAAVGLTLGVPRPGHVTVEVLDLQGRRIHTLVDGPVPSGALRLRWDGADGRGAPVGAGLYLVRARAAGEVAVTRILRSGR